jgi:DNA-binding NarL/FixJ family response regulator
MRLRELHWLAPPRQPLTHREEEIIRHLANGERTSAIAAALNIDTKTVWTHYLHIEQKWGLADSAALRAEAVVYTREHGRTYELALPKKRGRA